MVWSEGTLTAECRAAVVTANQALQEEIALHDSGEKPNEDPVFLLFLNLYRNEHIGRAVSAERSTAQGLQGYMARMEPSIFSKDLQDAGFTTADIEEVFLAFCS